jgi:hypothetical protein
MTSHAVDQKMPALDGEVGTGVDFLGVEHGPAVRRVAPAAVDAHSVAMNVLVARHAPPINLREVLDVVARQTVDVGVEANEAIVRLLMIETDFLERRRNVTFLARSLQLFMRTFVNRRPLSGNELTGKSQRGELQQGDRAKPFHYDPPAALVLSSRPSRV